MVFKVCEKKLCILAVATIGFVSIIFYLHATDYIAVSLPKQVASVTRIFWQDYELNATNYEEDDFDDDYSNSEESVGDGQDTPTGHYCNVHDYSIIMNTSSPEYDCSRSSTHPYVVQICLYPTAQDVWVSGNIRKGGAWEKNINTAIINALNRYSNASFLDIGANLGMHALVAAKMGRKVVAVEPKLETIKRLQKSVKLNNLTNNFVIVKNGVMDERSVFNLYSDNINQGGASLLGGLKVSEEVKTILFDDLLEVFHAKDAAIKMDIEASEARALVNSTAFFSRVNVHVIFMEWMNLANFLVGTKPNKDRDILLKMVSNLRQMGFQPRGVDELFQFQYLQPLNDNDMQKWPNDIVWIKPWPGITIQKPPTATSKRESFVEQTAVEYKHPPPTKYCNVHDYNTVYDTSFPEYGCVKSRGLIHDAIICLYPNPQDIYVSGSIRNGGSWERNINFSIQKALERYPKATFVDLGANLGMHALAMAKMGRKVLAVEPKLETVKRLQKSIKINNFTDSILLVKNGIMNERSNFTLLDNPKNQGGSAMVSSAANGQTVVCIVMDDLLEVFHDKEAVLKMDIEASEARALANSSKFFQQVKVQTIFMEWIKLKHFLKKPETNLDRRLLLSMVANLRGMGFEPRPIDPGFRFKNSPILTDKRMSAWPGDIVWIRPWEGVPTDKDVIGS